MFAFSLQTVLDVRERLEKIKYKEFSSELLERQKLESEIERNRQGLAGSGEKIDRLRRAGTTAAALQLYDRYRERLEAQNELLGEQLRTREQALEEKRKELVEARRAHRALEILRDKEKVRYDTEQSRRERMVMDEVASNYHIFRN